ncbi:MAG: D-sedoheptulose-7-phosphate isomerase [Acidimicrobiia bacterium]
MAEGTDFLYPFIEGDETGAEALLVDLAASAQGKGAQSTALRERTMEHSSAELQAASAAMAERFGAGGRLFAFGNGGSSTDAATVAATFSRPPAGLALPARALVEDSSVLTALGNDVGFDLVFSRQLIAHGRSGDIALGLSTSGNSRNLLMALREAASRGMLTVGLAGYGGGDMARAGLDHCLVVHSDSVHRVQETQAALAYALWAGVQAALRAMGSMPSPGSVA